MRCLVLALCVVASGCGKVVATLAQGQSCTSSSECESGSCVDAVCCDRACNATCEACVAAKTGATDGTCAPVAVGTDPDAECAAEAPSTCGATGAGCNGDAAAPDCVLFGAGTTCTTCTTSGTAVGSCNGEGMCELGPVASCGTYACNASGDGCLTSCTVLTDCASGNYCNSNHVCAKHLRVALETGAGSCTITQALPVVKAALEARGHIATIVSGADIDTAGELAAFDVVVTGALAPCAMDDRASYDAALGPWVTAGGGLVGTGWVLYVAPPANFAALMPNSGTGYLTGAQTMTPVGTHPIVAGLAPYAVSAAYTPYGGTPKSGSTQLLRDAASNATGEAWSQGTGRVVFLGPVFIDDYSAYMNQHLTDGTTPSSLEMFLRSIDWAGHSL